MRGRDCAQTCTVTHTYTLVYSNYGVHAGYLAFSFLCTFVPRSEKSIENFRSCGTFAPGERKVQELSHPWNVRSANKFRAL